MVVMETNVNTQNNPVVCWFRDDLRLSDHAALQAAIKSGRPLLALYVFDDINSKSWTLGQAGRWWLKRSLQALHESLVSLGGGLCLRRGDPGIVIPDFLAETGAEALYYCRAVEPWAREVEKRLQAELQATIEIAGFPGNSLFEPEQIKTSGGTPFKVFTPFWRACLKQPEPALFETLPNKIHFHPHIPESEDPEGLFETADTISFEGDFKPGEAGAGQALESFLDEALERYRDERDRPDLNATSRLSPYLHFGEISPRLIWHAVKAFQSVRADISVGADSFLRELGWREFCRHLLFHWPEIPQKPMRERFSDFPWRRAPSLLQAWQQGQTGYPIVDAGMRQLLHTGWMHNRVRMIVASFLVKDLLQPWLDGETWFWNRLVDADLANNAAGWQWVAGCGADAAPFFRLFNPVLQGKKFDPDGLYVKRWIPELSALPPRIVHEPWRASASELDKAGIELGRDYPLPLVDHASARQRALSLYQELNKNSF